MALNNNFCSSPWINTGIDYNGNYIRCRWEATPESQQNISKVSPLKFFTSDEMNEVRQTLTNGEQLLMCVECRVMEAFQKTSPRQKQLLKTGITLDQFEKSLLSAPKYNDFDYSHTHSGKTKLKPVDWQIHLSNYCNSACVFCAPQWSSRVETQYKELGWFTSNTTRWDNVDANISRLVKDISKSTDTRYIHFIGGETLITPGFKVILQQLAVLPHAKNMTIGFTTNLTVFDTEIVDLLSAFKEIHLGFSIESPTPINDYVRWPSKIDDVLSTLNKWIKVKPDNWLYQLRITPTMLTISTLHQLFALAEELNMPTESCNFLEEPEWLKINVLPMELRKKAADDLLAWVDNRASSEEINSRNTRFTSSVLIRDAQSYINYLNNAEDLSHLLPVTVQKLKQLETLRKNSILDYVTNDYTEILRSAGY